VKISFEDLQRISAVAIRLGVEGNAADIFAMRCAKAHAALMKREAVGEEDLIKAIQFVLLPRAAQIPDRVELAPIDKTSQAQKKSEKDPSSSALPDDNPSQKIDGANQSANLDEQKRQPQNQQQEQRREDNSQSKELQPQGVAVKPIEELIIQALAAQLPDGAMQSQIAKLPASEKAATGKRAEVSGGNRGRFARHSAKKTADKKIAFAATLRAASPFQNSRKSKDQSSTPTVKITAEDLRYKKFKKKSGMLFIFAVDASGSMALNRMAQAKGAMTRLLQEAYIHRDKVSLISFRKEVAAILLPPTRSVEQAKRVVDAVATGGTTPIAAALMQALRLAKSARSREISQTMLVMFTDGRANVGVGVAKDLPRDEREKAITRELRELGAALLSAGIAALVIDTKPKFVNAGDALELAETIGAKYLYLPRADDKTIYQTLAKTVKR
jgi:magnesium chelatase subunit D